MKNVTNLRGIILIVGLCLVSVSGLSNYLLYSSFSSNLLYSGVYSTMGVSFDVVKVCLAMAFGLLWFALRAYLFAIIALIFWVLLTLVSIISGFGFLSVMNSQTESQALMASTQFQTSQNAVILAQQKVGALANGADGNQASQANARIKVLKSELDQYLQSPAINLANHNVGTIAGRVGDCTGHGHYIMSYCPKIRQLEQEIEEQNEIISSNAGYLAAVAAKTQRQSELSLLNINSIGTSHIHPLFIGLSTLFKIDNPDQIKHKFLIISSILCELLGSFCLVLFGRLAALVPGTNNNYDLINTQTEQLTEQMTGQLPLQDETLEVKKKQSETQYETQSET